MASLRKLKKEVDYLVSEVISDGYACMVIHPSKNRDAVIGIIEEAVDVRNKLIDRANHPEEKHNARLIRKYYRTLRAEMFDDIDALFQKLSDACKA